MLKLMLEITWWLYVGLHPYCTIVALVTHTVGDWLFYPHQGQLLGHRQVEKAVVMREIKYTETTCGSDHLPDNPENILHPENVLTPS